VTSINDLLTEGRDPLEGLSLIEGLRREADEAERELIEKARASGIGWGAIAKALGLRSRQAAEQRWLRLCAVERRDPTSERRRRHGQHIVDETAGVQIERLRRAVIAAHKQVKRPELLRQTLAAAVDAPPGALFELAQKAADDARRQGLETRALRALREAVEAAKPA
jgi:hypothetical protein